MKSNFSPPCDDGDQGEKVADSRWIVLHLIDRLIKTPPIGVEPKEIEGRLKDLLGNPQIYGVIDVNSLTREGQEKNQREKPRDREISTKFISSRFGY